MNKKILSSFIKMIILILILSVLCLLLAFYVWKSKQGTYKSYIEETIDFFSSQDTPWLTSEQIDSFRSCSSYDCYSSRIVSLSSPSLVVNMLVGQPFKYIWRDRNSNELMKYLLSLKRNKVNSQTSISGHSSLYVDEFGEWPQGQHIIDSFVF